MFQDAPAEDEPPAETEEPAEEKKVEEKEMTEEEKTKKKKGCNNPEILAVLGHELGHWKLSHNLKNLVIGQVGCDSVL